MSFGLGRGSSSGFGGGAAVAPLAAAATIDASTPWLAAADGNLPLLQQSLQQLNLAIFAADEAQGYTLLMAAASYSQLRVIRWIVSQQQQQQSAQLLQNQVDKDGDSALHYASTVEAAKILVEEAGTDVQIRNAAGLTAYESKKQELDELLADEDTEEDDTDVVNLKGVVEYLGQLSSSRTMIDNNNNNKIAARTACCCYYELNNSLVACGVV